MRLVFLLFFIILSFNKHFLNLYSVPAIELTTRDTIMENPYSRERILTFGFYHLTRATGSKPAMIILCY